VYNKPQGKLIADPYNLASFVAGIVSGIRAYPGFRGRQHA
jgi:hypothetical protein